MHPFRIDLVLRVAFWGLLLLAAARISARLIGSRLTGLAHLAWDGTAGLALLVGVLLAVGLVPGGFQAVTIGAVVTVVLVAGALLARRDPVRRFAGIEIHALIPIGLVAVAGLFWNRVPPVFFDTLAYHFSQPELWLVEGRIAPEPWSLHSWFPPGMSVLFGIGLAFGDEAWANDANLLAGLLLIALIFDVGRRHFDAPVGLVAVLLLFTLPVIPYAFAMPAADLGHGLFVVAALAALLSVRGPDASEWIRRGALCAAGAALTKYLGLLVPLALGGIWLLVRTRNWRRAVAFGLPAAVMIAPWL
ncbi:MAG: glycosyltransferase family 39 protein, partial [Planctomycetota bacterium]